MSILPAVAFALLLLLAFAVSLSLIPLIFRRKFISKLTFLDDLPRVGDFRPEVDKIQGTAVVCGGSIAGLLAAGVCASHFESVVVVEPEAWLNTPAGTKSCQEHEYRIGEDGIRTRINPRSRVLQYAVQHGYQAPSLLILRKLFPDVDRQAALLGVTPQPADYKFTPSGITIPIPYDDYDEDTMPKALWMSREGFEALIRKLVKMHYPQVKFVTGAVTGINPSSSNRTILESVTIQHLGSEKSWNQPATLVVDATGAAQAGFTRWLGAAGYGSDLLSTSSTPLLSEPSLAPFRLSYDVRRWYITSTYKITDPDLQARLPLPGGWDALRPVLTYTSDVSREDPRSLMIARVEGDMLQIGTGGWSQAERPKTIDQIQKHVASTNPAKPIADWVHQLIEMLREVEDEATHSEVRIPACVYAQYHQVKDLPSNFVAVGDAVLRLSPAFGQGCSKAVIDATSLNAQLSKITSPSLQLGSEKRPMSRSLPTSFSATFNKTQHDRIGGLWETTKASDYGVPGTVPSKGEHVGMGFWRRRYTRQVAMLALKDAQVASTMWHVQQFLAPPTDLYLPSVTYKIMWQLFKTSIGF